MLANSSISIAYKNGIDNLYAPQGKKSVDITRVNNVRRYNFVINFVFHFICQKNMRHTLQATRYEAAFFQFAFIQITTRNKKRYIFLNFHCYV